MDDTSAKTGAGAQDDGGDAATATAPRRRFEDLPPAAQRALKEAEARRAVAEDAAVNAEPEVGGRGGKDPARYGDWEIGGRAIDF